MTKSHGPIKCAVCDRTVATISETGLGLPPPTMQVEHCIVCAQIRPSYDAMKIADELYASLAGRRDTYGPKQSAFADVKRTHREFSNLLARVEKHTEMREERSERQSESSKGVQSDRKGDGESSAKRPRSQSSNSVSGRAGSTSDRYTNMSATSKHKKLKFSESVEFREDYRASESYARSNEAYARGRYAPSDGSEHLDTSGNDQSFIKFTGMKKVGKKWVDVWKDDSVGDTPGIPASKDGVADVEDEGLTPSIGNDTTHQQAIPLDARTQRFAQKESTPNVNASVQDDMVMHGYDQTARTPPGQTVNEHVPIRSGSAIMERFHQQGEDSDLRDLVPPESQLETEDATSKSGVYDPVASKQDWTRGVVEHALVLNRSPHSRESSLDHTSIAADGHSPCTTHQGAAGDPYRKRPALLCEGKRPTADENTAQVPISGATPITGLPDPTKPPKDDR